jgi:hypothetical protein
MTVTNIRRRGTRADSVAHREAILVNGPRWQDFGAPSLSIGRTTIAFEGHA